MKQSSLHNSYIVLILRRVSSPFLWWQWYWCDARKSFYLNESRVENCRRYSSHIPFEYALMWELSWGYNYEIELFHISFHDYPEPSPISMLYIWQLKFDLRTWFKIWFFIYRFSNENYEHKCRFKFVWMCSRTHCYFPKNVLIEKTLLWAITLLRVIIDWWYSCREAIETLGWRIYTIWTM